MMFIKIAALALFPLLAVATPWGAPTTTSKASTTTSKASTTTSKAHTTTAKAPGTTTVTVTATATSTEPASQCNTGPVQCCNSVQSAGSPGAAGLLGLLGIVVQGANVPIGLTCSPLTVIGVGGTSCSASPVCCENNSFNGLVAIGCTPVNLAL